MLFRCYGNEKVETENQIARRGTPFSFCLFFNDHAFLLYDLSDLFMFDPLADIITPRLVLRLIPEEVMAACLSHQLEQAVRLFGTEIPAEMLEDMSGLEYGRKQLEADSAYLPWSARAMVSKAEDIVVGMIRFHSLPNPEYLQQYVPDAVEFGYEVFSRYQRQGYAREAAGAVMVWAETNFNIQHFIASVSPDNEASLKLISSFGFDKIDEVMDEVDGPEYVFLRAVPF